MEQSGWVVYGFESVFPPPPSDAKKKPWPLLVSAVRFGEAKEREG